MCYIIGCSSFFGCWFCYVIRICRKLGVGVYREKFMVIFIYLEKLMMEFFRVNYLIVRIFFIRGLMGYSLVWVIIVLGFCIFGYLVGIWI